MSDFSAILNIIPEDINARLIMLKERESGIAWEYGDIVNAIYNLVVANNLPITKLDVCAFIRFFTDCERSAFTLMDYARVAARFSKQEREDFGFLPFSHFRLAAGTDNPLELLEYSADYMAKHGYPLSVEKLKEKFTRPPEEQAQYPQMAQEQASLELQMVQRTDRLEPYLAPALPEHSENLEDDGLLLYLVQSIEAVLPAIRYKYPLVANVLAKTAYLLREIADGKLEPEQFAL